MPYIAETEGEYEKKYGALSINVKLRRKCCLGQDSRSAAGSSHQSTPVPIIVRILRAKVFSHMIFEAAVL
jgi:hypothetical protein